MILPPDGGRTNLLRVEKRKRDITPGERGQVSILKREERS